MRDDADRFNHMGGLNAEALLSQPLHHPHVVDVAPFPWHTAIRRSTKAHDLRAEGVIADHAAPTLIIGQDQLDVLHVGD